MGLINGASATPLSLGGGAVTLTANAVGNSAQTLGNLFVTGGGNSISLAQSGSVTMTLTLGNIWARSAGGTLNINAPSNTYVFANPLVTTTGGVPFTNPLLTNTGTGLTSLNGGGGTIIGGMATLEWPDRISRP